MQEVDAERRIKILRGLQVEESPKAAESNNINKTHDEPSAIGREGDLQERMTRTGT